jgi:hypothetical protein
VRPGGVDRRSDNATSVDVLSPGHGGPSLGVGREKIAQPVRKFPKGENWIFKVNPI